MSELVGGAFLSSFLSVLFARLASRPVLDFFSGKKNNNDLMRELQMKLLTANQLVDDAEEKQIRRPMVKEWLDNLKDAVYIVGDLLDEINTEALRRNLEGDDRSGSSSTSWIRRSILNTCPSAEFDKALEPKIVNILRELQLILNEKDVLGMKEGSVKDRSQEATRQTTSQVDDSGVFGREDDRKKIVNLLRSNDASSQNIGVLPIVGMGGIGKTTLAQLAYKDVKDEFDVQAWVCVGEEFDILRIAKAIYESITDPESRREITYLDLLSERLGEVLMDKKFLFVLDDVWNENYGLWDSFMTHFKQYERHGSKIIVTTRLEDFASKMGTLSTYRVGFMSEEDSWLLFAKHAFVDPGGPGSHPDLEVVGRQIVNKCNGLPLAAKSLGGLLRSELNLKKWENVLTSDIWELKNDNILPALRLSYAYLPSHLKRCFVCSSIFPKDYHFTKSELVSLWMAEDLLLQPKEIVTVEEVGNDYFDILKSRCFFQHSGSDEWSGESYFTMHDLINDLAKHLSGDFCLRLEDHPSLNINVVSKTRHFSYMKAGDHGFEKFEGLYEAKNLHTFLPLGLRYTLVNTSLLNLNKVLQELLPTLQCLRLLNLSGYGIAELPNSIGNLKHLRHLDLSLSSIKQLPDTVCTLYNLQTLLLSRCYLLVQLPTKLGRLINLRHLDINYTEIGKMPPDMGNLKDLQTLSDFVLDKHTGHSNLEELKKLQNLRTTITVSIIGQIVEEGNALAVDIMREKKHLDQLVLRWRRADQRGIECPEKDKELLNKLQPHTNLKEFVIESYWDISIPGWLGDPSFSNLSSIEVIDCNFCCFLPPLGQLPSLKKLKINGLINVVQIGAEFYGNDTCGIKPFRSLEELTFRNMLEWQDWSYVGGIEEEGGFFPNLRRLTLRECPKLNKILPLDNFLELQYLELSNLESFRGSFSHLETKCPKFLSLRYLTISRCPNFVRFPDDGIEAPKLWEMCVRECEKLRSLPQQMHTLLPSLRCLDIRFCLELGSFPEGGLPSKLESLWFDCSKKLYANRAQWGLTRLTSLRNLRMDFRECGEEVDSFPQEGLLPTTLTSLKFSNLPTLTTLQGKELSRLTFLQELRISGCPELQLFPEEAPNWLKKLKCHGCPKLLRLP